MLVNLNRLGLFLTLAGSTLLFFRSMFDRRFIGNTAYTADGQVMQWEPNAQQRPVPAHVWQPLADQFMKHARRANIIGFALIAIGTVLQLIATA
jgi:hypothetical protein